VANHKSAEKRNRQNKKRQARNRYVRSTMRTNVRKVREAVESAATTEGATPDEAKVLLVATMRKIDQAAAKGVIHKNQASRRISRLQKLVNSLG
jgi:small subunit ribosomal protein S20